MLTIASLFASEKTHFDAAALLDLRSAFAGELIEPDHPEYDEARRVWNGMIDRRPALIARCTNAADVQLAIAFAQAQELPIAVRGGSHSTPGYSTVDDGLVIDLSPMKGIVVDPVARTARVEPGVKLGELDRATQEFGLAVPAGTISDTGVAGLTLGGGKGWLMRKHGLTIDNLLAVEIVTADGTLRRASATEHPDLFWAVRGGGGNFGVVTAFEFQLHPVGPLVFGGPIAYTLDQGREVMRLYREFMETAPEELTALVAFLTVPPAPAFPVHLHGQPVIAIDLCYVGPLDQAEAVIAPFRTAVTPAIDMAGPMPFVVRQSIIDDFAGPGARNYHKGSNLAVLSDRFIDVLIERYARATSPSILIQLGRMGGAVSRVPNLATAYGNREAPYFCWVLGAWPQEDAARDEIHKAWIRDLVDEIGPDAAEGVYVNAVSDDNPRGAVDIYGTETYSWLARVKATYDPKNVFRLNQNIIPATKELLGPQNLARDEWAFLTSTRVS